MIRFSLAGSLWFVAFVAFGFAAVRNASDFWVGATFLTTLGLLCAAVIGAVLERSRGGVWWLGFALFGWAYLLAGLIPGLAEFAKLPSRDAARSIFAASNPRPADPSGVRAGGVMNLANTRIGPDGRPIGLSGQGYERRLYNSTIIGHWLLVLIFARAGATVSCVFTKGLPWRRRVPVEQAAA